MKFKYAYLLLFCGVFIVSAQEKINQFDANGKRTGVWKKYYANKRLRYQGQFEGGKEVGEFKFYSAQNSEHPISIKIFQENSAISIVKFFTIKGVLESEGQLNQKNRIGKWVFYHKDGKTMLSEEFYVNGLLEGVSKTYFENGKIAEILNYKQGKLQGNVKRYSDTGVLLDDLNYEDGKRQGIAKFYNIKGKLIYTGSYKNDEKVGKWKYFEDVKKLKQ
ncbi:toxin-antitoxin system YwqK family antitoxin [Lutibacter sp.]|uniref:toxin-antitoxin system YwqK family antitoxin n=1 Tax=Lutibacter sp. TaxID=1925666 RepID=UPI00356A6890